eukprot:UN25033
MTQVDHTVQKEDKSPNESAPKKNDLYSGFVNTDNLFGNQPVQKKQVTAKPKGKSMNQLAASGGPSNYNNGAGSVLNNKTNNNMTNNTFTQTNQ